MHILANHSIIYYEVGNAKLDEGSAPARVAASIKRRHRDDHQ